MVRRLLYCTWQPALGRPATMEIWNHPSGQIRNGDNLFLRTKNEKNDPSQDSREFEISGVVLFPWILNHPWMLSVKPWRGTIKCLGKHYDV